VLILGEFLGLISGEFSEKVNLDKFIVFFEDNLRPERILILVIIVFVAFTKIKSSDLKYKVGLSPKIDGRH
jgi:hypothetical protein